MSGWARNWYFILPDILVRYPKWDEEKGVFVMKTFQGIAIKLYDGVIVSWDARVIRHGTTVTEPVPSGKLGVNHTYGCVFVAKRNVMDEMRIIEEEKRRDDIAQEVAGLGFHPVARKPGS